MSIFATRCMKARARFDRDRIGRRRTEGGARAGEQVRLVRRGQQPYRGFATAKRFSSTLRLTGRRRRRAATLLTVRVESLVGPPRHLMISSARCSSGPGILR